MSTLLPTSIVGSLPKPSWLSEPETLWSPWRLEGAELDEGRRDALHLAAVGEGDAAQEVEQAPGKLGRRRLEVQNDGALGV